MQKRNRLSRAPLHHKALMGTLTACFLIIMVLPLFSLFSKVFFNSAGKWVFLQNYQTYFSTPTLSVSIGNTLYISAVSMVFSVALGFFYAYALTRTHMKGKAFFRYAALLPIFIPTIVHALGLVYLFGNQGIFTNLGMSVGLYGSLGIILSEIIYTFPQSFLMFSIALNYADGRLYEAADSMGSSKLTKFFRITIPEIKYTLVSAVFICFTLAFTDFGAPKVLGGSYNVLATDIYKQIAGQFNMNMGAVVGTLLLIPSIISFFVTRFTERKIRTEISSKATMLSIPKSKARDTVFFVYCSFIVAFLLLLVGALFMGALSAYYPYDMSLTLKNFTFDNSTGGIQSFFNSIYMSLLSAVFGTVFVYVYAYMTEKTNGMRLLKKLGRLLSVLPVALPGMVIGIAYIFFFNAADNPLHFIYGTVIILVLSNILHFYTVPYVTATGALKKLDREYESVSESMRIPRYKTFFKVSVPLTLPALLEMFMFYFVNSMVTVSAVVFLYSANFKIASIAITHMEEAGDNAHAAAMSLLILLVNVTLRVVYEIAVRAIKKRKQQIEKRETA